MGPLRPIRNYQNLHVLVSDRRSEPITTLRENRQSAHGNVHVRLTENVVDGRTHFGRAEFLIGHQLDEFHQTFAGIRQVALYLCTNSIYRVTVT